MNTLIVLRTTLLAAFVAFTAVAIAQPNTNSSYNRGERGRPSCPTQPPYEGQTTVVYTNGAEIGFGAPCYVEQRVWRPGEWVWDRAGRRWEPGRWDVQRLPAACPVSVGGGACWKHTLSPAAFEMALKSIAGRSFESTRLSIARQVVSENCLATMQVRQLMDLMTFESSRLELAKFAYHRTVDPQQYFLIYDAFTFDSSVRDLQRYVEANSR